MTSFPVGHQAFLWFCCYAVYVVTCWGFARAGSLGDSTLREQRHRTLSPVGRKEQYHGINSLPFGVACQRHGTQASLRKSNSVCFLLALQNCLIPWRSHGAKLRIVFSSRRANIFLLFRCPVPLAGQKIQIIPPQSYVNLPFYPEGPRKKSVHRRLAKPNSRFHVDSLPPFLFFGPSVPTTWAEKQASLIPSGQKLNLVYFLHRGKTNVIFKFGALEEARLLLNKLMLPRAQFGLLSYRGQDKRNFSFRNSRERDVTIEQINVPFGAEDQMGYAFPKG